MAADFYVMFGNEAYRRWVDARSYGFVSGGGGRRWSRPLRRLRVGDRLLVHVPEHGYVGTGLVEAEAESVEDFTVTVDGRERALLDLPLVSEGLGRHVGDAAAVEYVVRVRWDATVDERDAYWRPGLFFTRTTAWPWPADRADMAAEIREWLARNG